MYDCVCACLSLCVCARANCLHFVCVRARGRACTHDPAAVSRSTTCAKRPCGRMPPCKTSGWSKATGQKRRRALVKTAGENRGSRPDWRAEREGSRRTATAAAAVERGPLKAFFWPFCALRSLFWALSLLPHAAAGRLSWTCPGMHAVRCAVCVCVFVCLCVCVCV